jgi:hypothetical protein
VQVTGPAAIAYACGRLAYALTALVIYGVSVWRPWHTKKPLAGGSDSAVSAEPGSQLSNPPEGGKVSTFVHTYACWWHTEPAVLQAGAAFTWQAGQKVLLQEATRYVTRLVAGKS